MLDCLPLELRQCSFGTRITSQTFQLLQCFYNACNGGEELKRKSALGLISLVFIGIILIIDFVDITHSHFFFYHQGIFNTIHTFIYAIKCLSSICCVSDSMNRARGGYRGFRNTHSQFSGIKASI